MLLGGKLAFPLHLTTCSSLQPSQAHELHQLQDKLPLLSCVLSKEAYEYAEKEWEGMESKK